MKSCDFTSPIPLKRLTILQDITFTVQKWCQQQQLQKIYHFSSFFWGSKYGQPISLSVMPLFLEYSSVIQKELTVTIPVGGYLHDERSTDVRKDFLMFWEPRICICARTAGGAGFYSKASHYLRSWYHVAENNSKIQKKHNLHCYFFYFLQYYCKMVFCFPGRPFCFVLFLIKMLIK